MLTTQQLGRPIPAAALPADYVETPRERAHRWLWCVLLLLESVSGDQRQQGGNVTSGKR